MKASTSEKRNEYPMADEDTLPDHDYASIYGHEAFLARFIARIEALERKYDALAAKAKAALAQQTPRTE